MKKLFVLLAATMLLAACQTTSIPVSSKQPPRVVTQKSVPAAKKAVIDAFAGIGFKVIRKTSNTVVVEQILTPNSTERKQHASYSDGIPRARAALRFSRVDGGTQITSSFDMITNPGKANQEKVTLLDSPDGARLQRLLEGLQ
ncbi:hypothetical protein PsW64_00941 [Pseudovibrio sp. W64]|uniref:hypothetical protein n=1 Tax=unclassified Pseudovibrio TaxID=2627060 RepID=UPI0007AE5DB6|nr:MULTISPECIES: hypothetical protein [unclassified Pseudovibrio]KZK87644.1 hypothetical protein PsW64_00941 [Pseudovibrio sp. W64]KZK92510.1 hypothetical protein PsAD46_01350 [Pseudovibrio sp. Ad46]KZK98962.1 hypothetical protein PsAD5_01585 [Pseudovibrio sp. Ad5]